MEALHAATSVPAAILGASGQLGAIVPGAMADLVALDGDPLSDIRNTRRIRTVIKGGAVASTVHRSCRALDPRRASDHKE